MVPDEKRMMVVMLIEMKEQSGCEEELMLLLRGCEKKVVVDWMGKMGILMQTCRYDPRLKDWRNDFLVEKDNVEG